MTELRLLDVVSWRGVPVPGGRTRDLLAALVATEGQVSGERLVEQVWGPDGVPANPTKALQVVVSRARARTAPEVVASTEHGYRLGLRPEAVDALALRAAATAARTAEGHHDLVRARDLARAALAFPVPAGTPVGPLGELRRAAARHRVLAAGVLGRALSALGDHAEALALLTGTDDPSCADPSCADPSCADPSRADPGLGGATGADEATLVARLRSTAAVHGAPVALRDYQRHRAGLAERLGVDPGPALRAVHAELLAADRPVREGLRFEATPLVGRDSDVRALRAAVRAARVVSILGPGGLGKTRLAHVLGREAEQPVVHVVELVGVSSDQDVVGEVGSALGVRDSVSERRALSDRQRGDIRSRIAELLHRAPALLILDNCEHVVGAVAELVAFLVVSCPDLRVVTTTRAPLAIAAEQVFPLARLTDDAARDLFRQRASAARPGATLPDGAVRAVVARLDGLPLAVELAAAKVRVMSVQDIDRRLDDRFRLLRGGDRGAPDRHRTLAAVIDWSWNLLDEPERRALRRLSVFHDGFTLSGADALLGEDALDPVQSLVDQSLLTVLENSTTPGTVRYRMLETVREFGRLRLVDAREQDAAGAALLAWARGYAREHVDTLWSTAQIAAVAAVAEEEVNLSDVLRAALAGSDPVATTELTAVLAGFWTIRGENIRVIALLGAVDRTLTGWLPAPEQVDLAVLAAALVVLNSIVGVTADPAACRAILDEHGDAAVHPRTRGLAAVLRARDPADPEGTRQRLRVLEAAGDHPSDSMAMARLWVANHLENAGDIEGALDEVVSGFALLDDRHGPWLGAMMHELCGGLHAQLGRRTEAAVHARSAIPVLDALHAHDDAVRARSLLAGQAIAERRFDEAERTIEEMARRARRGTFGGAFVTASARAELALARGEVAEGLRRYRRAARELADFRLPGLERDPELSPWTLVGAASALTAFALFADGTDGQELFESMRAAAPRVVDPGRPYLDYPIAGLVLYGLGAWGLHKGGVEPADAVRLVVLADRFGCPRYAETLNPARTAAEVERAAPGLATRLRGEYGARRGPELLPQARSVVARLG